MPGTRFTLGPAEGRTRVPGMTTNRPGDPRNGCHSSCLHAGRVLTRDALKMPDGTEAIAEDQGRLTL
jgi:hypothetical protein